MIEVVQFGQGYRIDGPNWGERARPYLEDGWRPVKPGINMLSPPFSDPGFSTKILALSDGTGRLSFDIDPRVQEMLAARAQSGILALGRVMAASGVRIDQDNPVQALVNGRVSDMLAAGSWQAAHDSLRLMGVVRYTPENYAPTLKP